MNNIAYKKKKRQTEQFHMLLVRAMKGVIMQLKKKTICLE